MKTKNNIEHFLDYLLLFVGIGIISLSIFGILYNMLLGRSPIVILFNFTLLLGLWVYEIFISRKREYYENKK